MVGKRQLSTWAGVLGVFTFLIPLSARAENALQTEDGFREVFVTAGYSAAFGAAVGAALLPFFPNPSLSSLRYVAGGASLGFIAGSAFAFYNLSGSPANVYPAEEPAEDLGAEGEFEDVGAGPLALPQGSLVVGRGDKVGLSFPAFALVGRGALVNVLHYEH